MNLFPLDFEPNLTGFGGDRTKNRTEHREAITRTPVILVHGNAGHSAHPKWGMEIMRDFLKNHAQYDDCEIWAMDHLGENNTDLDLNDPHRNHITQFRIFVDRVRDYLGVSKVDFIAHSLGCGMVNGYLRGLQPNGQWSDGDNRLDAVSTFVSLAGATYGLGIAGIGEFRSGSRFEIDSHKLRDVIDDTPGGSNDPSAQEADDPSWKRSTSLDDSGVRYVAIIAKNDFVDAQQRNTGRREGADLNKGFDLGGGVEGHEKIIKSRTVFDAFRGHLNKTPPDGQVTIHVDKDDGSYGSGLEITVTTTPDPVPVDYTAERITRRFNAGYIERLVADVRTGTLASGDALALGSDGQWEVIFRAARAKRVQRAYGVDITLPEVEIRPAEPRFRDSLQVSAKTTRGVAYHSRDLETWVAEAALTIDRTTTVSFIAIDSDGVASPVVSRAYEKIVPWTDRQTATLTEHFLAGRLSTNQYVALGLELGFNAVVTLYRFGDRWTTDPEAPRTIRSVPLPAGVPAAVLAAGGTTIRADKPSGDHAEAFDVTISASGPGGGTVTVHYTEDGSDPSDRNNPQRHSFETAKAFMIRGNGHHAILCYAEDRRGNGIFETFAWSVDDQNYPETGIAPSLGGVYGRGVTVTLSPSETCAWTKYTLDGTEPDENTGTDYSGPIAINGTATLRFRSKDLQGHTEPVKTAAFSIVPETHKAVIASDPDKDGHVRANADSTDAVIGTFRNLAIGTRSDKDSRAILHFDTSALPDNITVTRAYLEIEPHSVAGDFRTGGTMIAVDVKRGHFGSSRGLQGHDWGAKATAETVARIGHLAPGANASSDFSEQGRDAIDPSGITQIRLRTEPRGRSPFGCVFLKGGAGARLVVEYS
ncbi:hypothetical protein N825_36035 [Skermanella stibiiresistens SB22]|uniref:GH29D-like beta-sandwich domain-containing protein n=1 Tax=Skermanella stibiiresistens SB22 TaxID=1385369 RepID=W9GSV3_9PROT|nr:alpha/beta fold hydrolase [Skermanella stibiiresistens]EWY35741.1 hypothetical protein N825_36035 [Skermanella stibiiresistens SB22]